MTAHVKISDSVNNALSIIKYKKKKKEQMEFILDYWNKSIFTFKHWKFKNKYFQVRKSN